MRVRSHPGQLLRIELEARDMSASQLALALRVPASRITRILRGERSVTPETALRLGRFLGTGAPFWMTLQTAHDLSLTEAQLGDRIEKEVSSPR